MLNKHFLGPQFVLSGTAERFFIGGANRAPKVRDI